MGLELVKEQQPVKQFKLQTEPVSYQLSFHMSNLFTYFHPANADMRLQGDRDVDATTSDILRTMKILIDDSSLVNRHLCREARYIYPVGFRGAQIIDAYGAETVKNWINLFYGEITRYG